MRAAVFPVVGRLRFGSELEPSFTEYHLEHSLPFARFALILALVLYSLFGILDFYIVQTSGPDGYGGIRYAIFCPAALFEIVQTFTRWFKPIMQPVLSAWRP